MSQTETLLLFVLGFCAALFVVLLFGRSVFAVLGKWSGWRETRKVPTAIRELQADRDGLKAEKAMMAQKLEASIGDMKMRMAEQMAEVSRNRNRLLDLGQTLKEREGTITHVQSQFDDKASQVIALQVQIEENVKSINLAYAKLASREEDLAKMQGVLKDAQATLMLRDEKIRNLVEEARSLREITISMTGKSLSTNMDDTVEIGQDMRMRANGHSMQSSSAIVAMPPTNSFETPATNTNGSINNPLLSATTDFTAMTEMFAPELRAKSSETVETETVDRSVSNVLSLAERVRNLKSGLNKA